MAQLIRLKTIAETRGKLTIIEKQLPFALKRIFYIYNVDDSVRGKHRHHKTLQAAVCLAGSCLVSNYDGKRREDFWLDAPDKCLILYPEDWHSMHHFTPNAVLMVMASTEFDPNDYIYEEYP